ncbi:MAG TPA: hypothetical protein VEB22_15450 [Phycisphaerales bacterium]|nr:hypothetical protein [Phycisphaerales bacterium]
MGLTLPIFGDGLPVIIIELGPPGRTIVLGGKDRPEPVVRSAEQRDVQSWYPGASSSSTQVLGVKEEPIPLRGWFRDPLSIIDGGAAVRVALLRGIQQGQRLCRLFWGDTIVAYGRVKRTAFEYETQHRVRYEIDFAVDKGDEAIALAPLPPLAATVADVASDLKYAASLFEEVVEVGRGVAALGAFVPE